MKQYPVGISNTVYYQERDDLPVIGVLWPSCHTMIEYFAKNPKTIAGKRIIELGSGCGLGALAAAYLGAQSVILTDKEDGVALLNANIQLNPDIKERCEAKRLLWGTEDVSQFSTPDVIIGSDIIYIEELFQPLVETLAALCGTTTRIIMAHQLRSEQEQHFWHLLEPHFDVSTIKHTTGKGEGITLYRLKKSTIRKRTRRDCSYCDFLCSKAEQGKALAAMPVANQPRL